MEAFKLEAKITRFWKRTHQHGWTIQKLGAACVCAVIISMALLRCAMLSDQSRSARESLVVERADRASSRTAYSVKSPEQMRKWFAWQKQLVAEAAMYKASEPGRTKIALIGDSITESWRGSSYGVLANRTKGVPEVFQETLAARWPHPLVLAISGDQTQHVLWRLSHGELSLAMATDPGLMFVLLIGTNNLGQGKTVCHSFNETCKGIMAVARVLLEKSKGKLLLNTVLPRGDGEPEMRELCPGPRCDLQGQAFHTFIPTIDSVNSQLASSIGTLAQEFLGRVDLVDCGRAYKTNTNNPLQDEEVKVDLMPDRLHPNAKGHQLFAECLQGALEELESRPVPDM